MGFQATVVEAVRYREVLANILYQDFKVKYQRTYFGYLWSLITPICQLTVLSVIFSHVTRLDMKNYTLYLFSGMIAWSYFQSATMMCARSFLDNENFIKKVYLPKILFPISKVSLRAVDFFLSFFALALIGVLFGFSIPNTIFWLPTIIVPFFLFTLGIGILAAIFTVYFQDLEYILAVFLNLVYFATPILYPLHVLPENYQRWMQWNPIYLQIKTFQEVIYYGRFPEWTVWAPMWGVSLLALGLGIGSLIWLEDDLVFKM